MKIGQFLDSNSTLQLGVVIPGSGPVRILNLSAAGHAQSHRPYFSVMNDFIAGGKSSLESGYTTLEWAMRQGDESWFHDEPSVPWQLPLQVRNCIAGGRNFGAHMAESMEYWKQRGVQTHTEIPMAFIKLASSMVATRTPVTRPEGCLWFDYEVEITVVIGKSARAVPESAAMEAVFGYTILNDLSARELQRKEMANQSILIGKNLPGLGPLGPWILTADEVPDPAKLSMELRVNGEVRQKATCDDLIFSVPALVAHWSRMGLDVGDLITLGSPEGVAISRKPDPMPFYLKPGDVVHARVDQIGTLETLII